MDVSHRVVLYDVTDMMCCGGPVSVGAPIVVGTSAVDETAWLEQVLGSTVASEVTDLEWAHVPPPNVDASRVTGRVTSIRIVFCSYAPSSRGGREPLPGTAVIQPRGSVDPWEQHATPGLPVFGWLIGLDVIDIDGPMSPEDLGLD